MQENPVEMPSYEWVITVDLIAEPGEKPGTTLNAVGVIGPSNAVNDAKYIQENGERFRMRDSDGNIYYSGYLVVHYEETGEEELGPLDDFGMPNAGCTEIQYNRNGQWETL